MDYSRNPDQLRKKSKTFETVKTELLNCIFFFFRYTDKNKVLLELITVRKKIEQNCLKVLNNKLETDILVRHSYCNISFSMWQINYYLFTKKDN